MPCLHHALSSPCSYTPEDIINAAPRTQIETAAEVSPLREVVFAVRAILPLNTALILLVLFVLRSPLPHLTVFLPADTLQQEARESGEEAHMPADELSVFPEPHLASSSDGAVANVEAGEASGASISDLIPVKPVPPPAKGCMDRYFPHGVWALLFGVLMGQIGQILFNLGLTYGFTSIGDQVGQLLPASFLEVEGEAGSPYFSYAGGIALTLTSTFILGFLATRAEPALNVLGATVEKLSAGSFTRRALVYAVCLGVASGMLIGATKILFGVPVIWILISE